MKDALTVRKKSIFRHFKNWPVSMGCLLNMVPLNTDLIVSVAI